MSTAPLGPGGITPVACWGPSSPPPATVYQLARQMKQGGGQLLVVGGWVRDQLLGLHPGDVDLEVFGLHPRQVLEVLGPRAHVVGNNFGIIKVGELDLSFPRARRRMGGRGDTLLEDSDPQLSLKEAARRRDFTINSLAWDPLNYALYDPFGGFADLVGSTLRHVDDISLGEDPLRVIRAARFVARFGFDLHPETLAKLRPLVPRLPELPRERPGDELRKMLIQGHFQEKGWQVLRQLGVVETLWPELASRGEEGWRQVSRALVQLGRGEEWRRVLATAIFLYDIDGPAAEGFVERVFGGEHLLLEKVPALLRAWSLVPTWGEESAPDGHIRRLSLISPMAWVVKGWEVLYGPSAALERLASRARGLGVWEQGPRPVIQGRDLLKEGLRPGPELGQELKVLFDAQLDGDFDDREGGLAWWRRRVAAGES